MTARGAVRAYEKPKKPDAEAKIMKPKRGVYAEEKMEDYLDEGRRALAWGQAGNKQLGNTASARELPT